MSTHRRPPAAAPLNLRIKLDRVVRPTSPLPSQRGPDAAGKNTILLIYLPNRPLRPLLHARRDRRPGTELPDLVERLIIAAEPARQVLRLNNINRSLKADGRERDSRRLVGQQPDGLPPLAALQ